MSAPPWLGAPHVLREYALIADGERGALVGPHGDMVWMYFPSWDSDALFSALIGGGGAYAITPRTRHVWGGYYEPRSLIWRSRWATADAIIECRHALALPADPDRATILCRALAVRGNAELTVRVNPLADWGRHGLRDLALGEDGVWRARVERLRVAWSGGERARVIREGRHAALELALTLSEGEHHDFVMVIAQDGEAVIAQPDLAWSETEDAWHRRVPDFAATLAPRDAAHAYAVMSGLSSRRGGMVAAATTSLPERAEEGRNYDYRYVWIRDQCYAGEAAAAAGAVELLDDSVRFVGERLRDEGSGLRPAYTARGTHVPAVRPLGLEGYPGGRALAGNRVNRQFQLDPFGECLLLFSAAADAGCLDAEGWRAAEIAAAAIAERWREDDAGIWEISPPGAWTHSRLICVAGLRAVSRHSPARREGARWLALADAILADTSRRALTPSGRWQRARGDTRVDAALLLVALRGAVAADDPRSKTTLDAVESELADDHYCYRFRPDARALGEAEGAFILCGFWMALALHQQGREREALRWFERNRAACGPPGLLSEEFDVRQRQLRGNLPQAFAHALLLECAATLGAGS